MFSQLAKSLGRWYQMEAEEENYDDDEYDVFLSFNGNDTRKGFVDHLYIQLTDAGLSVFKDDINLPVGQDIASSLVRALKRSRIVMPILSLNYAASRWCLDELVCMLKSRTLMDKRVIPVFYNVTPSQVRHQTGSYAQAFSQHLKDYDLETVDKWKKALAEVASLKGWELATDTAGREGKFTKLIVAKISDELNKDDPLLTGRIKKHAAKIKRVVNMGGTDKKIVAITGSLRDYVRIWREISEFWDKWEERRSVVKDVDKTATQHNDGLKQLQNQLVYDLSMEEHQSLTGNDDLRYKFRNKRVLILLHDVGDVDQLDALAGQLDWFGPGSRIIFTTRNKNVCNAHQVTDVYHLGKG